MGGILKELHLGLFAAIGVTPRIRLEVRHAHTILALVNRGIGLALVPASSAAMRMENLAFREIDLPDRFRSELYRAFGPKRSATTLHRRVADIIWRELTPAKGSAC